jgi:hypothetical protein
VEVEREAADERAGIGFGVGREVVLFEFGLDEGINRGTCWRCLDGLPGPVLEAFIGQRGLVRSVFGPRSTGLDPGLDGFDLRWRQRAALGRHALFLVRVGDALEEGRLVDFTHHDGRTVMTSFEGE